MIFLYILHTNSRLYFLCPAVSSVDTYSSPFPLISEELTNSKADSKFVSADRQARGNS